ncbi:MAG TPA: amino acid permease, partial [Epsilonproteobacteria bacterium]|nr:amino acid permease [Campylobacterota bacterium]
PVSAGEAVYIYEGLGSQKLSILVGLAIALSGMLSSATIIHGFYGYTSTFLEIPEFVLSIFLVSTLTLVAIWGIGESVKVASLLTLLEVFGLTLVIYVALPHITIDAQTLHMLTPPLDLVIINSIVLGAFLAFYAFIGFEDMVNIAQEVKEPSKTMPRAIVIVLLVSTLLYVLVAWVSIALVSAEELSSTTAPLAMVYEQATGSKAVILSFIGMFAVINGALIQIIMVSRILYGMSAKGWMPKFLGVVNTKTATPINATIATALMILILTLILPLLTLAQLTSFVIFIVFTLVNLALIKIKVKDPDPKDVKIYPIWIPVIAIILNLVMLSFQIVSLF